MHDKEHDWFGAAFTGFVTAIGGGSLRDMLLGTAIGMTPGTLAMMFFVDQIVQALKQPGPVTVLLVAITAGLIGLGIWGMRRWVRKVEKAQGVASHEAGGEGR